MTVVLELLFNEEVDAQSVADAVFIHLQHNEALEGVLIREVEE